MNNRDVVIVDAVRTPIGKGKPSGALARVHPVDLLAHSIGAILDRTGLDPREIEDVIGGLVTQVSAQAGNMVRRSVLAAGLPESVPAVTVDRQCGSSQQAIAFAAQSVMSGNADVVLAVGSESMSTVPMRSHYAGVADPDGRGLRARYPEGLVHQGISAELIAARWSLARTELDELSLRSHQRASEAIVSGRFASQIAPISGLESDEGVRHNLTLDALSGLDPAFRDDRMSERFPDIGWSVTAGNSSQLSDGSAAVLMMSATKAKDLGVTPLVRVRALAVVGDDPLYMLTAVTPATRKVLDRAGLSLADMDLVEINEAFASVVLAWQQELQADMDRVNVNGGAIALGHPLGASGARIATTLVHEMVARDAQFGLQTMCEAGGLANAMILERV